MYIYISLYHYRESSLYILLLYIYNYTNIYIYRIIHIYIYLYKYIYIAYNSYNCYGSKPISKIVRSYGCSSVHPPRFGTGFHQSPIWFMLGSFERWINGLVLLGQSSPETMVLIMKCRGFTMVFTMKYMFFLPWFPVIFPIIQFCEWMINEPIPPCLSVDGFKADGAYRLEKALSGHRRWGRSRFTKRPMEPDNFTIEAVRRPWVLCVFFPSP